jgi:hypothetical protein
MNKAIKMLCVSLTAVGLIACAEKPTEEVLREELLPQLKAQSSHLNAQSPQPEVIFYGSGCANETACSVSKRLYIKY